MRISGPKDDYARLHQLEDEGSSIAYGFSGMDSKACVHFALSRDPKKLIDIIFDLFVHLHVTGIPARCWQDTDILLVRQSWQCYMIPTTTLSNLTSTDSGFGEPRSKRRPATYRHLERKRTAKMAVCYSAFYRTENISSRAEVSLYQAACVPHLRRDSRVMANFPHDWIYSERLSVCSHATFQVAYIAV